MPTYLATTTSHSFIGSQGVKPPPWCWKKLRFFQHQGELCFLTLTPDWHCTECLLDYVKPSVLVNETVKLAGFCCQISWHRMRMQCWWRTMHHRRPSHTKQSTAPEGEKFFVFGHLMEVWSFALDAGLPGNNFSNQPRFHNFTLHRQT